MPPSTAPLGPPAGSTLGAPVYMLPAPGGPQSSAVGAGVRAGVRGAAPAAAGLAAGIPVGEGVAAVTSPFVTPVGGAALGLVAGGITGLGASWAANKAQDTALQAFPDFARAIGQDPEQQAADEEQHPVASYLGGLAPQAAMLRPNLSSLGDLLKGGPEALTAAGSLAVGATAGAVQEAGSEYAETGEVNPLRVGLAAGTGALLNHETSLGKAVASPGRRLFGLESTETTPIQDATPTDLLTHEEIPDPSVAAGTFQGTPDEATGPRLRPEDVFAGAAPATPSPPPIDPITQDLIARAQENAGAEQPSMFTNEQMGVGQAPPETPQAPPAAAPPPAPIAPTLEQPPAQAEMFTKREAGLGAGPDQDPVFSGPDPEATPDIYRSIVMDLRAANPNEDGTLKAPDGWTLRLANSLHEFVTNRDPQGAKDFLADQQQKLETAQLQPQTIEARQNTINAALAKLFGQQAPEGTPPALHNDTGLFGQLTTQDASAAIDKAFPGVNVTSPEPSPGDAAVREQSDRLAQAEQQQSQREAEFAAAGDATKYVDQHFQEQADNFKQAADQNRADTLQKVLDDPATRNPTGRFISALRAQGHEDLGIKPDEAAKIARFESARDTLPGQDEVRLTPPDENAPASDQPSEPVAANEPNPKQGELFTKTKNAKPTKAADQGERVAVPEAVPAPVPEPASAAAAKPARARLKLPKDAPAPESETVIPSAPEASAEPKPAERTRASTVRGEPVPTKEMLEDKVLGLHRKGIIDQTTLNQLNHIVQQDEIPIGDRNEMINRAVAEADKAPEATRTTDQARAEAKQLQATGGKDQVHDFAEHLHQEGLLSRESATGAQEALRDPERGMPEAFKAIRSGLDDKDASQRAADALGGDDTKLRAPDTVGGRVIRSVTDAGDQQKLYTSLRQKLDQAGLHNVALNLMPKVVRRGVEAAGSYDKGLEVDPVTGQSRLAPAINIATSYGEDAAHQTMRHEMMHALKDMDVFAPHEWEALARAAKADPDIQAFVNHEVYDNLTPAQRTEESIAELFARRYDDKQPTTFVGKLVQRFRNFVEAVKSALGGQPLAQHLSDAQAVMDRAEQGKLGQDPHAAAGEDANSEPRLRAPVDPAKAMKSKAEDTLTDMGDAGRRTVLNLLSQRQIRDEWGKIIPALYSWTDNLGLAAGKLRDRMEFASKPHDAWKALEKPEQGAVGKLLLDATVHQVDVDTPGTEQHDAYKALSSDAKTVYKQTLHTFTKQMADLKTILADHINSSDVLSAEEKTSAIADMNARLGKMQVYFPLMRIGDYINIAKSADYKAAEQAHEQALGRLNDLAAAGTPDEIAQARTAHAAAQDALSKAADEGYVVTAHEKRSDQERAAADMRAKGFDVRQKMAAEFDSRQDSVSPKFMTALNKVFEAQAQNPDTKEAAQGMRSMVNQLYFSMMPEGSALRNSLTRKGVAGFSEDAQRVYALASQRNAGFLTSLEHGVKSREILEQIRQQAEGQGVKGGQVYNQVKKQYNVMGRTAKQPVATFLANATYAYMLGLSPSFMFMHIMQTPMVTLPMLAARFKTGAATTELMKAFGEVIGNWRSLKGGQETSLGKTAGEKAMLQHMVDQNAISGTQAETFMQAGEAHSPLGQAGHTIMKYATIAPHYTEKLNRMGTALAAYRLALNDPKVLRDFTPEMHAQVMKDQPALAGLSRAQVAATRYALDVTLDSHVDYGRENAPYIMQPGVVPMGKLVFQFQKYQQAMLWSLAKNSKDMIDGSVAPEDRAIAARTLAGIVGTHAVMTGAMGLPGFGAAMFLANMYHKAFGDKNKPFDAETAFRQTVADHLGEGAAQAVDRGALYLPGVKDYLPGDITDRLGMGDLLASGNPIGVIDRQNFLQYLGSMAGGPAASLVGNLFDAYNFAQKGDGWKASEELMPKVMRDLSRAARFQADGITTASGNPVVNAQDLTPMEILSQAIGFSPQRAEAAYANRAGVQGAKAEMGDRKAVLLHEYVEATVHGDQGALAQVRDKISEFNQDRQQDGLYSEILTGSAIQKAVRERQMAGMRLDEGVSLAPRERALRQYGADAYPEN